MEVGPGTVYDCGALQPQADAVEWGLVELVDYPKQGLRRIAAELPREGDELRTLGCSRHRRGDGGQEKRAHLPSSSLKNLTLE